MAKFHLQNRVFKHVIGPKTFAITFPKHQLVPNDGPKSHSFDLGSVAARPRLDPWLGRSASICRGNSGDSGGGLEFPL